MKLSPNNTDGTHSTLPIQKSLSGAETKFEGTMPITSILQNAMIVLN